MNFEISIEELARVVNGRISGAFNHEDVVDEIKIDSRQLSVGKHSLFIALTGTNHDGHDYVKEINAKGGKYFIVHHEVAGLNDAVQLVVSNTLQALQQLAAWYRRKFKGKVVGITGSNGKTIVKEWLSDLLRAQFSVYKSPKSYNSQVGVPLSILNAPLDAEFYLFEAGISQPGEMIKLKQMIKPDFGVFTHLGKVHSENFESEAQLAEEKCVLFKDCTQVFLSTDESWSESIKSNLPEKSVMLYSSKSQQADTVINIKTTEKEFELTINHKEQFKLPLVFTDTISEKNLFLSVHAAINCGVDFVNLMKAIGSLSPVQMRLEWIQGVNGCSILNDSWTNDPDALNAALDYIKRTKKQDKTVVILSDFGEYYPETYYIQALERIYLHGVAELYLIGSEWKRLFQNKPSKCPEIVRLFDATSLFLQDESIGYFRDSAILVKGGRQFKFEHLIEHLSEKSHQTVLEINLDALAHNFQLLKRKVKGNAKVMAMVKAFAYGSGNYEVARLLQYHRADYLAVAFADEGVALRKAGIQIPIMVLNAQPEQWEILTLNQLEPVVFSTESLTSYLKKSDEKPISVHLEMDTGMHRLGFSLDEIATLTALLVKEPRIEVKSIFTHLAAADEAKHDAFTQKQVALFQQMIQPVLEVLLKKPLLHVSNSSGVIRFGSFNTDMVRLGIGMYGIDVTETLSHELLPVFTFKTSITQVKNIKRGESIGYGRSFIAEKDMQVAIIPVGYADGFNRKFSNGKGYVLINGKEVKVCGTVCMDMTMLDVTGMDCKEKDEVVLFGNKPKVEDWAEVLETIPYEVLTGISQRVKRVFLSGS